jgi:hypothetical protein
VSVAGTVVHRSLSPLPERTVSGFIWQSTSWTLEPDGFHATQAAPVEQFSHQLRGAVHERDDGSDFVARYDYGDIDFLGGAHGIDGASGELLRTHSSRNTRAFMAWF